MERMRGCSVEGCQDNGKIVRGFCKKHYLRWWTHGSPLILKRKENGSGSFQNGYKTLPCKSGSAIREHRMIAVRVLGKPLPQKAIVHHANEIKKDNKNANLVICQDRGYHLLLHSRMKAIKAGFPPHYRTCKFCKHFDDPVNFYIHDPAHPICKRTYEKERRNIL